MSELIQKHDNRATIRWKLLTGASVLALTAYVSSTAMARADDTDRPTIWIELGGDMDMMQGLSSPFTAPFMYLTPTPKVYGSTTFTHDQAPPRFAFGGDGKITFQPEDSDWIFSAGIRYGRSHAKRNARHQSAAPPVTLFSIYTSTNFDTEMARDVKALSSERHTILDFRAGKDVGIGVFGHDGTSTISAGVRIMDIKEGSAINIFARPKVLFGFKPKYYTSYISIPHQYTMTAHTARSFKGIGPSLSWNASAALAGNKQDGELTLDWDIDAAMLFGRQKAKTDHRTAGYFKTASAYIHHALPSYSPPHVHHSTRSRNVTVPNVGGFAGLSMNYTNVKVSVGYRADIFFGAMDRGIDARRTSNLTFNGPYASFSVGIGN